MTCNCMDNALYGTCWCHKDDECCEANAAGEPCTCNPLAHLHDEDWADAKFDEMRDNRDFGEEV